jgi:nucleoside-diphosphate-sugar epimerase
MKKILVTGGSGYFGSILIEKLLKKGYQCVNLDINDANDRPSKVEFVQADVRDYEKVCEAMEGVEVVYHNIAQVPLAKDVNLFESVNGQGTANVMSAAFQFRVKKFVYTSSSAVFGVPLVNPVTEKTLPNPAEAYGIAKYKGELLCQQYRENGMDVSIVRPRTIMGHGRLGIFQILFEWVAQGYNIPVLGRGDNVYQFIHADDLADACILAGEKTGAETFNCGAAKYGTMREVLEHLCEHAGTGSKVRSVPIAPAVLGMKITSALGLSPLGSYHALMYGRSMYFDITKTQLSLGWNPRYSNSEMFVNSYQWYINNRDQVLSQNGFSHHRSAVKQGVLDLLKFVL